MRSSYGKTLSCVKEPMCASVDPDLCVDLLMQIVRQFWKQHVIARHRRKKRPIVLSYRLMERTVIPNFVEPKSG